MTGREHSEADLDVSNEPVTANDDTRRSGDRADEESGVGKANDHQLLAAYVRGDEQAFEQLVEKYYRMVHTVAARQTGDSHLAEEVAQSVFLILSRKARGLSARTSIPGWLLRSTRFVAWDAIKLRRRREENEQKLANSLELQPDVRTEASAVELLLEEAIEALQPEEQAGIVARFFEGKDFQQIAEMFAITEEAARKRTTRCVAKLQNFMVRRGAKIALPALTALLLARPAHAITHQALATAIQAICAACSGNVAAGSAGALAEHAMELMRWRSMRGSSLKLGLAALVLFAGVWSVFEWTRPVGGRIERLGIAWGALDERVAAHRKFLMESPANAPDFQAKIQEQLNAIGRESGRIINKLSPLLAPPDERYLFAQFLTAGLSKTLNLEPARQETLLAYIHTRLAQGATFKDSMKALAETTKSEAAEIKAMLTPAQKEMFDKIYGPDGTLLFSYAKVVALGTIGP